MELLSQGEWGPERWSDLIGSANSFSRESGLFEDSSRHELVTMAASSVAGAGFEGELVVMLCMLGESVVIAPLNPEDQGGWVKRVITGLEQAGLNGMESSVARLS